MNNKGEFSETEDCLLKYLDILEGLAQGQDTFSVIWLIHS